MRLAKNISAILATMLITLSMIAGTTSAFAAPPTNGKDVSTKLEFTNFDFKHHAWKPDYSNLELKDFNPSNPIRSYIGESGYIDFNVKIPDDVKAGDYFIIDYGKYVRPGGIETPIGLTPLISEGKYITDIVYDAASNRVFHRFNANVEKKDNVTVHYQDPIWQKYDQVTDSKKLYPVALTIGGKSYKKELSYDYGNGDKGSYKVVHGANINVDSSGVKKRITQVWHVNRDGESIPNGDHTLLWESNTNDAFESIKVYEVTDDRAFTDSPNPTPNAAYVKEVKATPYKDEKGGTRVNLGNGLAAGKKYIVITTANPAGTASVDWLSVRDKDNHSRPNDSMGIQIGVNNSASSGQGNNKPGMFIETHRYERVDEAGNVLKVDETVTKFPQKGLETEHYSTGKEDRESYKFVRAENPKNEPSYAKDGSRTSGSFKPGITQEITYVYQKVVPTKGNVNINYINTTGQVIKDKVVDTKDGAAGSDYNAAEEGEKPEVIKKDGKTYRLVTKKGVTKDGRVYDAAGVAVGASDSPSVGKVEAGVTKEVTYVYELVTEQPEPGPTPKPTPQPEPSPAPKPTPQPEPSPAQKPTPQPEPSPAQKPAPPSARQTVPVSREVKKAPAAERARLSNTGVAVALPLSLAAAGLIVIGSAIFKNRKTLH